MKVCLTTIVTDNYFQLYLPLFIYTIRKEYPEYDIKTFIKGEMSELNKKVFEKFNLPKPISIFQKIPEIKSTINSLRFLIPQKHFMGYDYIIFLDADLLIYRTVPTLLDWHLERMEKIGSCYAGHHGPWKKRYRPEVSKSGWRGKFERVSGGFFMVTQKWFEKTRHARKHYLDLAKAGNLGGYREYDEVMLGNILKISNMRMPPMGFKRLLRGVHLGDFKPAMKARYKSRNKMKIKVAVKHAKKFLEYNNDEKWVKLCEMVNEEKYISNILKTATKYLTKRGKCKR